MNINQADFLDLLYRHYSYYPYSPKTGSKKRAQEKMIEKSLTKSWHEIKHGKKFQTNYKNNKMMAAIYLNDESLFYAPKKKLKTLKIFIDGKADSQIKKWCFQKINQLTKDLKRATHFSIPLALADKSDLNISAVVLIGEVKKAKNNLKKHYGNDLKKFDSIYHDFKFVPLRTKEQVAKRISIIKKEFSRNPQFGHFCTQPTFLKIVKRELNKEIEKKSPYAFAILQGKKIVGGFHADIRSADKNHFRVKLASVGIDLDESIQNKGLLKFIYFTLMNALHDHKISLFTGGTSQPGVLKLSKIMGRKLLFLEVTKNRSYFPREHFKDFL